MQGVREHASGICQRKYKTKWNITTLQDFSEHLGVTLFNNLLYFSLVLSSGTCSSQGFFIYPREKLCIKWCKRCWIHYLFSLLGIFCFWGIIVITTTSSFRGLQSVKACQWKLYLQLAVINHLKTEFWYNVCSHRATKDYEYWVTELLGRHCIQQPPAEIPLHTVACMASWSLDCWKVYAYTTN